MRLPVLKDLFRDNPLLPLLAVAFFLMAGMGMVWSMLAFYIEALGAGTALVGVMIAGFGGPRLLINLPAGMAAERFGSSPTRAATSSMRRGARTGARSRSSLRIPRARRRISLPATTTTRRPRLRRPITC